MNARQRFMDQMKLQAWDDFTLFNACWDIAALQHDVSWMCAACRHINCRLGAFSTQCFCGSQEAITGEALLAEIERLKQQAQQDFATPPGRDE